MTLFYHRFGHRLACAYMRKHCALLLKQLGTTPQTYVSRHCFAAVTRSLKTYLTGNSYTGGGKCRGKAEQREQSVCTCVSRAFFGDTYR